MQVSHLVPARRVRQAERCGVATFTFFATLSALALGVVLAQWKGAPSLSVLMSLTASIGALGMAACGPATRLLDQRARKGLPLLMAATLGVFVAYASRPSFPAQSGPRGDTAGWLLLSGAVLVGVRFTAKDFSIQTIRKWLLPVVLIGFVLVSVRTIRTVPHPQIDVFLYQQAAAKALLEGRNPYTATIPDIYGPGSPFADPLVRNGRTVNGFPYPPITAFLEVPSFVLTGDIRYTHVLALVLSAWLIVFMRRSWLSLWAGLLVVVNPFAQSMIEDAWVEPLGIVFLCASLFLVSRHPKFLPYLFGLFLSTKQPLLALIPFAPMLIGSSWRSKTVVPFIAKSLAVVAALYLPFYLWDPRAFVMSLVTLQIRVPMRIDLISYTAFAAAKGWFLPPAWLPFLYLPIGLSLGLWRAPRTPAGFAAASALLLVPFFALSKQGAPNYYFQGMAMICAAIGTAPRSGDREPANLPSEI